MSCLLVFPQRCKARKSKRKHEKQASFRQMATTAGLPEPNFLTGAEACVIQLNEEASVQDSWQQEAGVGVPRQTGETL